ncbi:MAG: S9 family peptidase [Paludibacter sp.]|nr:S9 family peptidase [Paludibacter sp.]
MKKTTFILVLITAVFQVNANLLYDITDGKFKPEKTTIPLSMNDGEHYTLMVDNKAIVKYSYKTGEAVDTLLSISKSKNPPISSFSGYILSPKETKILVYTNEKKRYRRSFTAEYYVYDIKYKEFDPLSSQIPQEAPVFSPDDRYIAFAHNNNLYMKKVEFKTDIQITKDGAKGKIINGIADWLYEEEFTDTHYYSWSPDSKLLAFIKFNENDVKEFTFQTFLNPENKEPLLYPEFKTFKYPKAGENNSKVSVCIYDDFNKTTRTIKLNETEQSYYIPRIRWTNNPEQLAVFQLNRNQNRLDMYFANPKSGLSKLINRLEDKYYVDYQNIDFLYFSSDNKSYYTVNEKDGYRHIYQHRMDGTILRQITKGNWDVTDFYGVDEANATIYYQSAEYSPMQRDIFSINAKGKKICLTNAKGTHNAYFSNNFRYFVLDESNVAMPNTLSMRNSTGQKIRDIANNAAIKEAFRTLKVSQKEFFSFKTRENIALNGWMIKPVNFDPTKKYPVLMVQYSGPGSQMVLDEWDFGWEYYLSTLNYVVVCVDGRGTGARGSEFMKCTYKQMGVLETRDQVETAKYLGDLSYIDKNRIGIWGWSFGGTMTLTAMSTGEKVFKAGISVAPVTDWRFYNTAYTERFMQTPQENFSGYDQSSALLNAGKLNGRLLIIHGTSDDNVHYTNTLVYINKLVELEKQFEMQIYTDKNHSITGKQTRRHLYTRMVEFLERNL